MPVICRRAVLQTAGVLAVGGSAGCAVTAAAQPRAGVPDPQLADLEAERRLLRSYDSVLTAFPQLGAQLSPLRADHAAHAKALTGMLAAVTGTPIGTATGTGPPATHGHRFPSATAALAALAVAERAAAAARTTSCVAAPRDRAPMLASIAASETVHVLLLTTTAP